MNLLIGKRRPEYVGKIVFDGRRFVGVVTQAVESPGGKKVYCQVVYNADEYDYLYIRDEVSCGPVLIQDPIAMPTSKKLKSVV